MTTKKTEQNRTLILDFDSTFISLESLDILLKNSLKNNPRTDQIEDEIEKITSLGMLGELSFSQSLEQRLSLITPTKESIKETIKILKQNVSKSILNQKTWIQKNVDNIWIISGGFKELILPVIKDFKINPEQVLANSFIFDTHQNFAGYDKNNFLSMDKGKVKAVDNLKKNPKDLWMIGDGWTDWELKESKLVEKFIYFAENINRQKVSQKADFIANDFKQIIDLLEKYNKL